MGGSVSTAESNEEMVDNLVQAEYITDFRTEQALRFSIIF